jgi:signal transduction histidine kinase
MKKLVRDLIIGKEIYIESRNEYRQVILSGQYAMLSLLVIAFYIGMDVSNGFSGTNTIFSIAFIIIFFSLVLHRQQLHCIANYFLFPTLNILLYLIVSSESKSTGAFLFFIPVSLGSFAVFNYSQRKIAIAFALFSFILFAVSLIYNVSIIPYRNYSDHAIQLSQLINFSVAFPVSAMAVYLLISLNFHTATQLIQSNKQLRKLNDELDRFVYSTSHDLRAPLLSVLGLLKLAEENVSDKEMNRYHQMMHTRLSSLDKFIKDITDYSRNNRLDIIKENIHVSSLADEIWE